MSNVTAFTLGEMHFKECQLVHEFLNTRVRPRVTHAADLVRGATSDTFNGALLRILSWMRSLWKLNEPADFQAATVAARTLFEIAVDVTILHFDSANNPPTKLLAWEDSAKLKAAIELRDYHLRKGEPLATDDPQMIFIAAHGQRIENLRMQLWRGPKHPWNRWTGRNLRDDARAALHLFPEAEFEEFYETRHAQVCWNTHGSGLAGVRAIQQEHFPGISALAFKDAAFYALVAAELILRHFGMWDLATAVEFDDHKVERVIVKYSTMTGAPPEILRTALTSNAE